MGGVRTLVKAPPSLEKVATPPVGLSVEFELCVLLEVSVVPSKAEVPAGNVVEQLGLCLTHQQQLVHLNTFHSCASLTGKCKQSVLISNKCHSQIQLECLGLSK